MICLFWCFVVLIDLMCHLSRIGYDGADDQSFELFVSVSISIFHSLCSCLCPLALSGAEREKRRMTYHIGAERFLFLALRGKHNIRSLILPPAASVVTLSQSHTEQQ